MQTYKFKIVARCPNDTSVNIYKVTIKSKTMIQVEEFLRIQNEYYNRDIYQEDLFHNLKDKYNDVKVVGNHLGVEIISK
tara:strand:+ start:221 stop:457 length:237 start_codon:yes stop_codon:yes gene_type:complete